MSEREIRFETEKNVQRISVDLFQQSNVLHFKTFFRPLMNCCVHFEKRK